MIDTCASLSLIPMCRISIQPMKRKTKALFRIKRKLLFLAQDLFVSVRVLNLDYSTVHAIWSIREAGYEAIIINNNPETVSTDYTTSISFILSR